MASIEDNRQKAYTYFQIKKKVRFEIETDNRHVYIEGYVERNEPNIFSKKEDMQISLICPDPYFKSVNKNVTKFSGVNSLFEFPFENSGTEPMLEMGDIRILTEQNVFYGGDAETGVTITMHITGHVSNITLYNSETKEKMNIDVGKIQEITGEELLLGDDIIINTNRNEKSIMLLREGQYINILNCIDKTADWFQLVRGDNVFGYAADEGVYNIQFTVEYDTLYEGI